MFFMGLIETSKLQPPCLQWLYCTFPLVSQKRLVCVYKQAQRVWFHISDVTVDGAEAWKSDPSLPPKVTLGPCVDPLD